MRLLRNLIAWVFIMVLAQQSLLASTLFLKDGSQLEGELVKINDKKVVFQTQFAGVLEIEQSLVSNISSDSIVFLKTDSGEVLRGSVDRTGESMVVVSPRGSLHTSMDEVVAAWPEGESDPVVKAREAELESKMRKWSYQVGVDVSGSSGNTENMKNSIQATARMDGPHDELIIYGSYKYAQSNNLASEDEQIGGIRYTNYFSGSLGWFLRSELERDTFEDIEFRSTNAVGLSYIWVEKETMKLTTSAGISYRYESYFPTLTNPTPEAESFPGLDFGLDYYWKFADWGQLNTKLTYLPSFNDFGDYLFSHETGIDIPLASSDQWKLRIGVSNQFNSNPDPGREELDTSYFVRMIMDWK